MDEGSKKCQLSNAVNELQNDKVFEESSIEEAMEVEASLEAIRDEYPDAVVNMAKKMDKHRKFGPFGKLHNIIVTLRTSSQILKVFLRRSTANCSIRACYYYVGSEC